MTSTFVGRLGQDVDESEITYVDAQYARKSGARSKVDPYEAPFDYADCFEKYFDYVEGLVIKLGIERQNAPDVASEIMLRFLDRDFLAEFDPDRVFEYRGQKRRARFKSFLSVFVSRYVMHFRDRQALLAKREPLICDMPVSGDPDGQLWIEVFGNGVEDDLSGIEEWDVVRRIDAHLATLVVRGKRDLRKLFELMVDQVRKYGKENRQELARAFGVSDTAVHSMIKDLRTEVRSVLAT